mmetsp:Transcript_47410/g.100751  ORF Transcript_47410/g.100751 Transcript_47410/m.100751 type:complete len:141 (+) Transcript_47410:268-690(+)
MAKAPELNLFNLAKFLGMYRDDGEIVWEGDLNTDFLADWLHRFQSCINVVGGDDVQFTMDIWKPGEETRTIVPKKIKVVRNSSFPYLDSQMSYDENKNLVFAAYKKPEFKTKYLDMKSCHLRSCKKAITRGVGIVWARHT